MEKEDPLTGPDWEKWRNEQVQTISNILSHVFKTEDEAQQIQSPSRLLRNPARESIGSEKDVCEKLHAILEHISEYEQMLQLSRKRIDKVLEVIKPAPLPERANPPVENKSGNSMHGLRKWVRKKFVKRFIRKKS